MKIAEITSMNGWTRRPATGTPPRWCGPRGWHKASRTGSTNARYQLGLLYRDRTGNEADALPWYELAAQRCYPDSAYELAVEEG
jgi:TPR repeat protein